MLPPPIALVILDLQNLGVNPATRPQGTTSILITRPMTPTQVTSIIDLTMEGFNKVKSSNHPKQDKWVACEERLRFVEGFDVSNLIRATEICLVPNVVVSKEFRVPKFIKYTGLK
jgi:hypothetical protein